MCPFKCIVIAALGSLYVSHKTDVLIIQHCVLSFYSLYMHVLTCVHFFLGQEESAQHIFRLFPHAFLSKKIDYTDSTVMNN